MRTFANILIGHTIVLLAGGFVAGCILGAHFFVWNWMSNHGWAWCLSVATVPAVVLWFVMMAELGGSVREG